MIRFLQGTPSRHEVLALASANSAVIMLAGWFADKDLFGTAVVATLVGSVTYVLGKQLTIVKQPRPARRFGLGWKVVWVLALIASFDLAVAGGTYLAVRAYHWPTTVIAPTTSYASAGRTIQSSPCPTGHLFGPGPSGAYVCIVAVSPLPPDPGTGPVLAPPSR